MKQGQTKGTANKDFLVFENIYVTGDETYSLEKIFKGLELKRELESLSKDIKIISIGEGVSDLVEVGLRKDLGFNNSYSLDPIYSKKKIPDNKAGRQLRSYIKRNQGYLLPYYSDNTRQESGTFDLVLSHMLVNNFIYNKDKFSADSTLKELYRITKPGGKILILGFQIYNKVKVFGERNGKNWSDSRYSWNKLELKMHVEKLLKKSKAIVKESQTMPYLFLLKIKKVP